MSSEKVKMALEEIREKSNYLQILGNYKLYNLEIYSDQQDFINKNKKKERIR